ncbi:MAG: alpha/beta hydrolase [Pseudomonadota bacterium]
MIRRFSRLLAGGFAATMVAYAVAAGFLILNRQELIYPFLPGASVDPVIGLPNGEIAHLASQDGTPVALWISEPDEGHPVVLTFMGNAGNIRASAARTRHLADAGYGIVLMNYRGAGGMPGQPSQDAIMADSLLVYDSLEDLFDQQIPSQRVVIYGYSLGAAVAVQLAAQRPSAAVILGAPFNRLCETAEFHYPAFPVCHILPDNHWPSADVIAQINAPLLILHGEKDEVIPVQQAQLLFEEAKDPKELRLYPEANHADLNLYGARKDIREWLTRTLP